MEQEQGKRRSPVPAGYDTGSCKKTDENPKEALSDTSEALYKNQGGQVSISEKHTTAGETSDVDVTGTEESDTSKHSKMKSAVEHKRKHKVYNLRRRKKCQKERQKDSLSMASTIDFPDRMLDRPPPDTLREKGMIRSPSFAADATPGDTQCDIREMELSGRAGPSNNPFGALHGADSEYARFYDREKEKDKSPGSTDRASLLWPELDSPEYNDDDVLLSSLEKLSKELDELTKAFDMGGGGPSFCPSPAFTSRSGEKAFELMSVHSESASGGESDAQLEMEASATGMDNSGTSTQSAHSLFNTSSLYLGWRKRASNFLHRSHSVPSMSQITSAENMTLTGDVNFHDYCAMRTDTTVTDTDSTDSDFDTYEYIKTKSAVEHKRYLRGHNLRKRKKILGIADSPDRRLDQPPPGALTETGVVKRRFSGPDATPGDTQYDIREMELSGRAGPSNYPSGAPHDVELEFSRCYVREEDSFENDLFYSLGQEMFDPIRMDGGPIFHSSSAGSGETAFDLLSVQPESESESGSASLVQMERAVNSSVTNTQPTHSLLQTSSSDPGWSKRGSSCLPRSHSVPSLSLIPSAENKTFTRAKSSPDVLLESSFEEFTPQISDDGNDETYWFRCSCPGLYQCSVTGLVFHMEGEGDVVYRIVPWNRRLLAQHHKQPAGPLFDIKCLQRSVCQLHLPHCEIRSTAGPPFLSVAHVNDEGIEFIAPREITETHVIINITGFSGFGNVKDEDSAADPVRALVLLFYRPPADPDLTSLLNVLLLPRNVVLRDVLRSRKKLVGDESYIETSPHCKLQPKQEYTLSTCPEDDSVVVQPKEAEFDCDNYDNYFPSFQVSLEEITKHLKLFLSDANNHSVWERRVCLSAAAVKRSCGSSALNLPPNERLLDIRSSFIEGISGPVLKTLVDKLLKKKVLADSERESADEKQNRRDKAGFVIDTVRKKGDAASSEMIEVLCELDPFLCEHLGLT